MNGINQIDQDEMIYKVIYKKRKGIVVLRRMGNMLFVSGHGPENQITGEPLFRGRIGEDLTLEEGRRAAGECAVIILGALQDYLGDLDHLEGILKVFGLVNCGETFSDIQQVMDGFSDMIMEVLEERGYHTRTEMGTRNLPNGNIPVEIEVIAAVREGY